MKTLKVKPETKATRVAKRRADDHNYRVFVHPAHVIAMERLDDGQYKLTLSNGLSAYTDSTQLAQIHGGGAYPAPDKPGEPPRP